ncbi:MAG: Spy/CpxP family protein refolding chaperone, partial [Proteobacteria bacterium]|nr:Spy/CpxP family protein refolding chaperone [Pseudomonadota bacterium]
MTRNPSSFHMILLSLGLTAALGIGGCALAQPADAQTGVRPIHVDPMVHLDLGELRAEHQARLEGRLAFVKARLQITEMQTPLWSAYAATMRARQETAPGADIRFGHRGSRAERPTLPQRLDLRQRMLDAQAERLAAMEQTLLPLYAALSDEQKEIAERILKEVGERLGFLVSVGLE